MFNFFKISDSRKTPEDVERIGKNILDLRKLAEKLSYVSKLAAMTPPIAHIMVERLLEIKVVRGYPKIEKQLRQALYGDNNQKLVLDSPKRFKEIINQTISEINLQIYEEELKIEEIQKNE